MGHMDLKYIKNSVFWNVTPWSLVRIKISSLFPANLNAGKNDGAIDLGHAGGSLSWATTTLKWKVPPKRRRTVARLWRRHVSSDRTLHSHSTPQILLPPRHADKRALAVPRAGAAVRLPHCANSRHGQTWHRTSLLASARSLLTQVSSYGWH